MVDTAHLARIDAIVARHHDLYLAETWAAHPGAAEYHADIVDRCHRMTYRMQARHLQPA
jgi:hypothetical protein